MTDTSLIDAALFPIAGKRATARIEGDRASIILDVTGLDAPAREAIERDVKAAAEGVAGIATVRIALTSQRTRRLLIAVASGKGGVGKSTVAANLAIALTRKGMRVGLVDADIYGPSQPRLLDAEIQPEARDKKLVPVSTKAGVPLLSLGQLVKPGQAVAWRGPMAGNALSQLIDAHWDGVDILIVDLPPGTGDVQLSMIQKHKPAGAVIVSTPQDLALIDAERAIDLFNKAGVPVIGLIENMAGYACPSCGEISDPFGQGGAEAEAAKLGLPFLGRIPLAIEIRRASDAGTPDPTPFMAIAEAVAARLNP